MIDPGTRFGAYEIVAPLGAGGMGEVYRARDTRLGRDVAVKVLPRRLADTPEIRARFEREARTISSLNHPNICTLHDVGREGDTDYLVMELVEGESLAERIVRGPLPAADLLRIGMQIADALDRAHRAGVIHRDLKPGNVMLGKTGAKLLDFGLARAAGLDALAAESSSPTMSRPLTAEGTIVGTFQYMAPEQLEGKEADARTDIWALGCVLYEMATGRRAFEGRSQASLISSIMGSQPKAIAELAPLSPPALERLTRACLAKDPEERIQTAHDVKLQLQWIAEGGSQAGVAAPVAARRRSRERLAWALFGVAAVAALGLTAMALRPKPPERSAIFELTPPPQVRSIDLPRISPDGQLLAFNAADSTGVQSIWVRRMNSLDAQRLPKTEGATRPFWSPDSRFLAFFTGGKLYKIDVNGGPPILLCDAPRGADGSWSPRGVILFDGTSLDSVQSVPAGGGVPGGATWIHREKGEVSTAWPQFLPDGRRFLYIAYGSSPGDRRLLVGSLGSREVKSLGRAGSRTEYASGCLLYVQQGTLLAQRFDTRALKLEGDPFPVAENVETDAVGSARFSTSAEGTLVYRAGGGGGTTERPTWTDRHGKQLGVPGPAARYATPALSPDGRLLAVQVTDPTRGVGNIWLGDLVRNLPTRLTFSDQDVSDPTWSPDGSRVVYAARQAAGTDLRVKRVDSSDPDSVLYHSDTRIFPECWSRDGRWIVCQTDRARSGHTNTYGLLLGDSARLVPLATGPFTEAQAMLSPDGKWLAYTSNESGEFEIYVQSFPGPGGKWRVSATSGLEPSWRGDSRELYYLTTTGEVMAAEITPGSVPGISAPVKLFDAPLGPPFPTRNRYVVTRDGQRFLFLAPAGARTVGATTVVLGWLARLRAH
jgi:serine/threonine protein kinase/dipeptidyl aminopeptidase/acylaminoacyl peptidase